MQKPVTAKESGYGCRDELGLVWSWSSMQGWRPRQEDAHIALGTMSESGAWSAAGFFAVLDGHGGPEVAQLVKQRLPMEIVAQSSDRKHHTPSSLKQAFLKVDERIGTPDGRKELRNLGRQLGKEDMVGCAAVACVVDRDTVVVANVGDCRAVLCRVGGEAVPLTKDHTADLPRERVRILAAGGWIEPEETPWGEVKHRVNSVLNLSRALGDMKFKKDPHLRPSEQIVSAVPDVTTAKREPGDEFLILASDGIWETRSEQFIVDFVRNSIRKNGPGSDGDSKVLEALLDTCLSSHPGKTRGLGCDNMTAILIRFTKDVSKAKDDSRVEEILHCKTSGNESSREGVTQHCDKVVGKQDLILPARRKIKKRKVNRDTDRENGTQRNQENSTPEYQQQELKKRRVNGDTDKENGAPYNQQSGAPENQQEENKKSCDSADPLSTSTFAKRHKDPRPEWQKGLAQRILETSGHSRRPGVVLKSMQPWESQSMRGWEP
eukprot:gnl/MRDRNA2_/MRDRNA2_88139_c0_seq1.p1 gnl/MRDRNA2_/MRDRNA2_88139_c0~~gnl/MRDRNA2_/MRDRNA2_88139_c0_seq1.p1  ORF type:complete len:492 (-),score=93.25 gnl/MRDRNA2_/MRDRNA2_88139_c0_seq1:119-1594(-)